MVHANRTFKSNRFCLKADFENNVYAFVSGKRKREVDLVLPASFSARTKNEKHEKVFDNKLGKQKSKYCHFEVQDTVDI